MEHAAGALGVTTTGTPVFGWHDRTIGTRVNTADGERWLHVVAEMSHCASILRPDIINDVHATFTDLLDNPSGRVAQLAAILKLLCLVENGEHLDIAAPLHRHARTLITHL